MKAGTALAHLYTSLTRKHSIVAHCCGNYTGLQPEQSDPEAGSRREPEKVAERKKPTLYTQGTWNRPEVTPSGFHLYKQYFLLPILTKRGHYKTEKFKILSYRKISKLITLTFNKVCN